jgi:hypothetical protein
LGPRYIFAVPYLYTHTWWPLATDLLSGGVSHLALLLYSLSMGTCSCLVLFGFICMFANMSILYHTVSLVPSQAYLILKYAETLQMTCPYTIKVDLVKGAGDSGVSTGDSGRGSFEQSFRARGGEEWFILPHPPPCLPPTPAAPFAIDRSPEPLQALGSAVPPANQLLGGVGSIPPIDFAPWTPVNLSSISSI